MPRSWHCSNWRSLTLAHLRPHLKHSCGPEHQGVKQRVSLSGKVRSRLTGGTAEYLHGVNKHLLHEKDRMANAVTAHGHFVR